MGAEFWEQLEARELPSETVPLPLPGGGTVEVELRALPADQWDAICETFPSTREGDPPGSIDTVGMRPALLAAAVVAPEGSPPKSPDWWAALAKNGNATSGELDQLFNTAWGLNRRQMLRADLGKD